MTTQDITALTSLLCALVTYEVEISQALENADLEISNYIDFRYDLAHALAVVIDPDSEPTAQPEEQPEGDPKMMFRVLSPKVSARIVKLDGTSEVVEGFGNSPETSWEEPTDA